MNRTGRRMQEVRTTINPGKVDTRVPYSGQNQVRVGSIILKSLLTLLLGWHAALFASDGMEHNPDRDAVIAMMLKWEAAVESNDFETLENYYTDDAIYYPNQSKPLIGRDSILERNRQRGDAGQVDIIQEVDDVKIQGDWAIYSCRARVRLLKQQDSKVAERQVRVLLLLERGEDGQWRILRDIDNEPLFE
jgi:uncharacterized protein (TIGR02246 family)